MPRKAFPERGARRLGRLLCAAAVAACSPGEAEPEAPPRGEAPLRVTRRTVEQRVLLTGALEAVESVNLSPPSTSAGRLTIKWLAEDGAEVAAGERLVEFDSSELVERLRELELQKLQAQNQLESTRAEATVAAEEKKIEVERKRVAVEKAKLDARIPPSMIARRDFQENQLALEKAKTELETARDELEAQREAAEHEEQVEEIELAKIRRKIERLERQLDALVLRAPRDGILVIADHPWRGRKFQVGDSAWPAMAVAKVPDLSEMRVRAALSDVDDGRVSAGMEARCVLDAYPDEPYECEVTAVSPVAREPSEDAERRFFDVRVALAETDPEVMRPGMSVRVEVRARRAEAALAAPRAGLDLSGQTPEAALFGGGSAEVDVGFCTPQVCTVEGGLEEETRLRRAGGAR